MRFAEFLQCFKDCRTTDDDDSMRLRLRRDGQGGVTTSARRPLQP